MLDDLDDLIKKNNEEVGDENSNIFEEYADLLYEFDGRWFKWNDYEFKEAPDINGNLNRYVAPIIGEGTWQDISMYRLQPQVERYRPVIGDKGGRTSSRNAKQPENKKFIHYKTLIDLANDIDDDEAVLDFYREYGPLGLLQHNAVTIKKQGRFRRKERNPWELVPSKDFFYKMHNGWVHETYICVDPNGPLYHAYKNAEIDTRGPFDIELNNILARELNTVDYFTEQQVYYPDELLPVELEKGERDSTVTVFNSREIYSEPYVIGRANPFYPKIAQDPIGFGLSPYFAITGDRTSYDYPCPQSSEFMKQYVESVELFRCTVKLFAQIYEKIKNPEKFNDKDVREAYQFMNAGNDVNVFSNRVASDRSGELFDYDSILGCFMFSMIYGLSDGNGFDRCIAPRKRETGLCGRIFVKEYANQKYCSTRCGSRTRTRESRKYRAQS